MNRTMVYKDTIEQTNLNLEQSKPQLKQTTSFRYSNQEYKSSIKAIEFRRKNLTCFDGSTAKKIVGLLCRIPQK